MSIDFDELQAAGGPKATLAPATQISGAGHSAAVQGFNGLASVYVELQVDFTRARYGPRGLTILLESSTDNVSWSTAHTFTFGDSGTQAATVDTPADYLRLSWTPDNASDWTLLSALAAPPVINTAGGGGGSQTLADVLTAGNDGGGTKMQNTGIDLGAADFSFVVAVTDGEIGYNPVDISANHLKINLDQANWFADLRISAASPSALLASFCKNDVDDVILASSGGKLGFYGKTAVTRPVIPATPTAQDIADVLVALGLATQAA